MSLTFSSFNFDKPLYNQDDPINLTVTYTSDDLDSGTTVTTAVSVALSDVSNTATQVSDGSAAFPEFSVETPSGAPQAVSVTATDPRPGTWILVSNSFAGDSAPFTGTALLSSVA